MTLFLIKAALLSGLSGVVGLVTMPLRYVLLTEGIALAVGLLAVVLTAQRAAGHLATSTDRQCPQLLLR